MLKKDLAMKNLEDIKTRFLKEPFNARLGHLASDLVHIASFLEYPKDIKAANDVLEESKFFIEWTAPGAPFDVQSFLSEIQPQLSLWHLKLQQQKGNLKDIGEVKRLTRRWSDRLLEISGLVKI